jgi:hypothetical protein
MHGCLSLLMMGSFAAQSPAALTKLTPPSPPVAIPIPTGYQGRSKLLSIEHALGSGAGRVSVWERSGDDGGSYTEWTFGGGLERRTVSLDREGEYHRIYAIRQQAVLGGRIIGAGWRGMRYVGNRYDVRLEAEVSPSRLRLTGWVTYFPLEGVGIGFGWGPTSIFPVTRLELGADEWAELADMYSSLTNLQLLEAFLDDLFQ